MEWLDDLQTKIFCRKNHIIFDLKLLQNELVYVQGDQVHITKTKTDPAAYRILVQFEFLF